MSQFCFPRLGIALCGSMWVAAAGLARADPNDNWWTGFDAPPAGKGLSYVSTSLEVHDGKLYVGGLFTYAGNQTCANNIARWNGMGWQPLACGTDGVVWTLLSRGSDLYVAGEFSVVGGMQVQNIARWDGQWHTFGPGFNEGVRELTVYDDELVAVGHFEESDGSPGNLVARWDGSAWNPLGSGLLGGFAITATEYAGDLYVGGNFTQAGGNAATHLARWNGTNWDNLGADITVGASVWVWPVEALSTEYNGNLIVGGSMSHINGIYVNGLAEWDGTSWCPLGIGLSPDAGIQDITVYNGDLVVFGYFTGPDDSGRVARWNGVEWLGFGDGCMDNELFGGPGAATVYNGELYVGGEIGVAGDHNSRYIARWQDPPSTEAPTIASGPSVFLYQPRPNPFHGVGTVVYSLDRDLDVNLSVHDSAGRLVAELVSGLQASGRHECVWNARTRLGAPVASGVYFVRLSTEDGVLTRKAVVRR